MSNDHAWLTVTLRDWLENQRHVQTPHRAAHRAAIDGRDIDSVRSLLAEAPFSDEQRKYLDDLIDRWEKALPTADE